MRLLIAFSAFLLSASLYGQNDYSMSFDGVNDFVNLSSLNGSVMQSFSYLGSFKTLGDNGGEQPVINTQNGMVSLFTNPNSIWGAHYQNRDGETPRLRVDSGLTNSYSIQPNVWYNFAYVVNQNISKIYVNDILLDSTEIYEALQSGPYSLSQIGSHGRNSTMGNTSFFNGLIDNLSVWNHDLNQQEIQQYMNCPPTGTEEGLVGYWNFEEGSGATAFDQTENGNDGTINGATYSTDVPEQNCIEVLTPNGGEVYEHGDVMQITWLGEFPGTGAGIGLVKNGVQLYDIVGDVDSDTSYDWVIPESVEYGDDYQVRVYDAGPEEEMDLSDGYFSIVKYGCTDFGACNYDADATNDDESCEYITPVDLGEDITTCEETLTLDAGEGYDSYLWSNGEITQSIEVSESGDYSVEVVNGDVNNSSLSFDGMDDIINNINTNTSVSDYTIAFYFKTDVIQPSLGNNDQIFRYWLGSDTYEINIGGYILGTNYPGEVFGYPQYSSGVSMSYSSGVMYNDDVWHYVVIAKSSASSQLETYVDGVLSATFPESYNDGVLSFEIGGDNVHRYEGYLNYVSIYNDYLPNTSCQSFADYSSNLIGYWDFTEGEGDVIYDLSSNGNDGTINGATWSTETPEQSCSACSSSDEITVTINQPTISYTDITACDSVVWNGLTYSESGTYSYNGGNNPANISGFTYEGYHNGSYYYSSDLNQNWQTAKTICENAGGHLVCITSQAEQDYIYQQIQWPTFNNNHSWIGLTDENVEGTFEWVSGEPLNFTNYDISWNNTNPSTSDYVEQQTSGPISGTWNDQGDGTQLKPFILEMSSQLTNTNGCDSTAVLNLNLVSCESLAALCGVGTIWDSESQECIVANSTDTDFDGCTGVNDVLDILAAYGDCGEVNYSLSFDGVDDYVVVDPFIRNASSDLTIHVHAKGKGTMTCPKTSEYESYFNYVNDENGNRIVFHLGIFTPQSGHEWTVGEDLSTEHQFYTIILDDLGNGSTLAELFLNGVSLGQHTYPYSIPSYSYMEIGRNIVEGNGLYDGVISEIHMWDGLLTEQQIQSYMSTPPTGNEEGLVGYWDFNEGTGSTLTDQTSNGNDGVINGATWSTDVPTAP